MQVEVLGFSQAHKDSPSIVAIARVRLILDGEYIELHDLRVIRNKRGELFVSPFSYLRDGQFLPTLIFSRKLKLSIDAAVLPALEHWLLGTSAQGVQTAGGAQ